MGMKVGMDAMDACTSESAGGMMMMKES